MAGAAPAVEHNVREVLGRIGEAALRSGRKPSDVALMAAVKTRRAEEIEAVVGAGVAFIGENRVQEGEEHIAAISPAVRQRCRVHFIGRLQSNKARKALLAFDSIDSVDSPGLARRLSSIASEESVKRNVMIEVNCGEEQKGGIRASGARALGELLFTLPGLTLTGLMAVPPIAADPNETRPVFRQLKRLFDEIRACHPAPEVFVFLSMGMSNDYEAAVEEGATLVRAGTALFGQRRTP